MLTLNRYIEHTLLKPTATKQDIRRLCDEAKKYDFMGVCVNPCYVEYAASLLKDSEVKVVTVLSFPLGADTSASKAISAKQYAELGADEIDMVINICALRSGDLDAVYDDIRAVRMMLDSPKKLKVIIETALLSDEEKISACRIAKRAEADFVKTCTGFTEGGATVYDVMLMRRSVGFDMGIKASGKVTTSAQAYALIEAGATRIGTSSGIELVARL